MKKSVANKKAQVAIDRVAAIMQMEDCPDEVQEPAQRIIDQLRNLMSTIHNLKRKP